MHDKTEILPFQKIQAWYENIAMHPTHRNFYHHYYYVCGFLDTEFVFTVLEDIERLWEVW